MDGFAFLVAVGSFVLALVALKVFIGDMSNIAGLLRILSFVGLGFRLFGIGWLFQRFVRGAAPVRAQQTE